MLDTLLILLAVAGSYLLGSIPTGYWYGRLRGKDIRQLGSGNPGATNVQRVFGTGAGILVLLVDALKGFAAVYWLVWLTPHPGSDLIRVSCALAAIAGHTFTVFLQFKGGKGVATALGTFLALAPLATFLVLLVFVGVVAATRHISAGSMAAAALLPLLIWIDGESGQYFSILILALVVSTLILVRHRSNLARLLRGEENRFGQPSSHDQDGPA